MKSSVERNSSIELLRCLSIFGILLLHTFSSYFGIATHLNLKYGLFVNSLCNSCVTIMFLISGYYGIKTNKKKIISIWLMVLFYSMLESASKVIFYDVKIDQLLLMKTFLPLTVGDVNWFLRTYIIIALFSDKINLIIDKEKKSDLLRSILILIIIFNLIPTITKVQFLGDTGKGIINMLIVYIIGRYICKYVNNISRIKIFCIGMVTLIIELLLNGYATAKAGFSGVTAPYRLDYSIFILVIGICIFCFFTTFNFKNKIINTMAKSTLSIILIDHVVRLVVPYYIDMSYARLYNMLPVYLILYSMFIFFTGFIFHNIEIKFFKKIDSFIIDSVMKILEKLDNFIIKRCD